MRHILRMDALNAMARCYVTKVKGAEVSAKVDKHHGNETQAQGRYRTTNSNFPATPRTSDGLMALWDGRC